MKVAILISDSVIPGKPVGFNLSCAHGNHQRMTTPFVSRCGVLGRKPRGALETSSGKRESLFPAFTTPRAITPVLFNNMTYRHRPLAKGGHFNVVKIKVVESASYLLVLSNAVAVCWRQEEAMTAIIILLMSQDLTVWKTRCQDRSCNGLN
jgi:hypothetical protein